MPTLNQYASKIANMVGRQGDHETKERIKDAFKATFANRIRQTVERNGIDSTLALTFMAEVGVFPINSALYKNTQGSGKEYRTINKVPVPIRIKNDAPFLSVTDEKSQFNFISVSQAEHRLRISSLSTGYWCSYITVNNYLVLHINTKVGLTGYINNGDLIPISDTEPFPKYIMITMIAENPEEIITMYSNDDGQDVELPFPNDMLEEIMYQILKVEFGIMPKEMEVKINNPIPIVSKNG